MTTYQSASASSAPGPQFLKSRRFRLGLITAVAVIGASVTVPALAGTDPDVRLIVGLEAAGRQDTAEKLDDKGYDLKTADGLEPLGARTLDVPEDDATKIAAKLRDQDGVAFVQLDRKVSVLAAPSESASADPEPSGSASAAAPEPPAAGPPAAVPPATGPSAAGPDETPTSTSPPPTAEPTIGEDPGNPGGSNAPTTTPTANTPAPTESHPPTGTWDATAQLKVPDALRTATSWSAQTVAVVDTGVTAVGPLTGAVLSGANVLENAPDQADARDDSTDGHGTAIASLVQAACPSCKILPVKAIDKRGSAFDSEVSAGITYAADQGARVINLSFGAPVQPGTPDANALLQTAIDYARGKGAVVVASAGNDGRGDGKWYPAANNGVLAVGGTNETGARYTKADDPEGDSGSSYGASWVDLAAPFCATALAPSGNTKQMCGTSVSAALTSGVGALVKSRSSAANQWSIENALTSTATPPVSTDRWVAYGEVRADRAVVKLDATAPAMGNTTPGYMQWFRGTYTLSASGVSDSGGGYPAGSGADHAWLYADGKYIGSDYSAPFAVPYKSGTLNRTVKFQWKLFDKAGNVGILNRNARADNTPPALTWTAGPANNAKVKGTVKVTAKSTDTGGAGVYRVELWINGKLTQWDWTSGYAFSINTAKYGKTIKVQLQSRDKLGNIRYLTTRTWKR